MRLMFVYSLPRDRGYASDVRTYMRIAREFGHEVALYGRDVPGSSVPRSLDIEAADGVVLIMEVFHKLDHDPDALLALMDRVPRRRRLIVDSCGMYNDCVTIDGDYNHPDAASSRRRIDLCDAITDKIFQTTCAPLRSNVQSFLFAGYEPERAHRFDSSSKELGICYVGNNWFRWRPLHRVLSALQPVREQVGRIAIVGNGWREIAQTVEAPLRDAACYTDPAYLAALNVELFPSVQVGEVFGWMNKAVANPLLVRPLFEHLGIVTPHVFETFMANTIPILAVEKTYAKAVYGEEAAELVLGDRPAEQILDVVRRPGYYERIAAAIRRRLAAEHSHAVRFRQLAEAIES